MRTLLLAKLKCNRRDRGTLFQNIHNILENKYEHA